VWQVILSALLTLATTVGCVWAAGRIFRIGLLSQGKSASFRQMARWIFTR
jgi:ABC-2 type transport system permease protein